MNQNALISAQFEPRFLNFKQPAGTSRGILQKKEFYLLKIKQNEKIGVGECNLFKGLSYDDVPEYEHQLQWTCENIHLGLGILIQKNQKFPSIQFGLEQAFLDLNSIHSLLFPSKFTQEEDSILINGLIWMGKSSFLEEQIRDKIKDRFHCIKLKIGALNWSDEYQLLKNIRKTFCAEDLEIRVDANGAFSYKQAKDVLKQLADIGIHSIEQPIKQGQWQEMARLCQETPTPIALDEELIGVISSEKRRELIEMVLPQYIILKPSLVGGFKESESWISLAEDHKVNWWVTSALESNIGLNAIAQWTYTLGNPLPQGLGTGNLFTKNFSSQLYLKHDKIWHKRSSL